MGPRSGNLVISNSRILRQDRGTVALAGGQIRKAPLAVHEDMPKWNLASLFLRPKSQFQNIQFQIIQKVGAGNISLARDLDCYLHASPEDNFLAGPSTL